jgi:short subunit dehydrogenase-like uncharacterized protein
MSKSNFLLYGANGYTGKLIAKYASEYGLKPILAGRNENEISALAKELDLPYHILDLNDKEKLNSILAEVVLVLHAAGPFKFTSKAMLQACLETGTHYLDITGEIEVFEKVKRLNDKALDKNIMLMPGVGFDVVPTDCMALHLKNLMPDATHLKLAFATVGGSISTGTANTMIEGMGDGGAVRENGKIIKKPIGHKGMWVDFSDKKMFVMTIPWGDLSTAHFTTGISNIETYTSIAPKTFKLMKFQKLFNWALRTSFVRNYFKRKLKQKPAGPNDQKRLKAKSHVWGQVKNASGDIIECSISMPDGYTLTALSSLIITKKVLEGNFKTGYQTPASCYGADLVLEIPNTGKFEKL